MDGPGVSVSPVAASACRLVCLTKASAMQLPYALPGYAMAGSGRSGSVTAMAPIPSRTAATSTAQNRSAPALALSVEQAGEALGVPWDTWRAHIEPDVRLVRVGRRKLIPVSELQAWLDRHAESVGV